MQLISCDSNMVTFDGTNKACAFGHASDRDWARMQCRTSWGMRRMRQRLKRLQ